MPPSRSTCVAAEARRERSRAHRLDQIAGEARRLQRRQFVPLGRRDQHDAARDRCAARLPARSQAAGPSARSTSIASQRRSRAAARAAIVASGSDAGPRAPAVEPARDQRRLDRCRAPRSASPGRQDRAARTVGLQLRRRRGSATRERGTSSRRRARSRRAMRAAHALDDAREIASPSPVPPNLRAVPPSACSNSWKMRACSSGAMPMPVSRTRKRISLPRRRPGSTMMATPPRFGELDRVAGEIEQHLAQPRGIADHACAAGRRRRRSAISRPLACARGASSSTVSSTSAAQIERPRLEVEPAGLDLGEIEDLLDQRQQRVARGLHRLGVGRLLGRERRVEQQIRPCRGCR